MVSIHLTSYFFQYSTLYLYRHHISSETLKDIELNPQDTSFKVISSSKEADELVCHGFEDFRMYDVKSKKYLDKGAWLLCFC